MGAVTPIAIATKALGGLFGGVSAYQGAQATKEGAEINAFIGRTRAIQTDTAAREGLSSELASMRAAFAASGQRPGVGTAEVMRELRRVRGRERRVEVGNRMQDASGLKMAAANAGMEARAGLVGGFLKAGPSIFDLYDYYKG